MMIEGVRKLYWVDESKTMMQAEVLIPSVSSDYVPIAASLDDKSEVCDELIKRALKGEYGEITMYSHPEMALIDAETVWQTTELAKVEGALEPYTQDMQIPEQYSELRKTTNTEENYYKLLMDRKLLVEYLLQPDFPECGRPTLSGLSV